MPATTTTTTTTTSQPPPVGRRQGTSLPEELRPPQTESEPSIAEEADAPPPEILEASFAKFLAALSLLLRSRWGTVRRHHPDLGLSVDLLDGCDTQWMMQTPLQRLQAQSGEPCEDTVSLSCTSGGVRRGMRTVQRLHDRHERTAADPYTSRQQPLIDSPRSMALLVQKGFTADAMRALPRDTLTTERRRKQLAALLPQYHSLCRDVSSEFINSVLRGEVDPAAHVVDSPGRSGGARRGVASPSSSSSPSPRQRRRGSAGSCVGESPLPQVVVTPKSGQHPTLDEKGTKCPPGRRVIPRHPVMAVSSSVGTSPPTATSQRRTERVTDLTRLQRHRNDVTVEWGARQQALAKHMFQHEKVSTLVESHKDAVRAGVAARQGTPPLKGSRSGTAQTTSSTVGDGSAVGSVDPFPGPTTAQHHKQQQHLLQSRPASRGELACSTSSATWHRPGTADSVLLPQTRPSATRSNTFDGGTRSMGAPAGRGSLVPVTTTNAGTPPHPGSQTPQPVSNIPPHQRRHKDSRMEQVQRDRERKVEAQRLEAERRIAAKEKRVVEAAERRQAALQEMRALQDAKASSAREVSERMHRMSAVTNLNLVRRLEQETAARVSWEEAQEARAQRRRYEAKLRHTLRDTTKDLLERSATQLRKATSRQEVFVGSPVQVQRNLKDASRAKLVQLLEEEDKIIQQWERYERFVESPVVLPPSRGGSGRSSRASTPPRLASPAPAGE